MSSDVASSHVSPVPLEKPPLGHTSFQSLTSRLRVTSARSPAKRTPILRGLGSSSLSDFDPDLEEWPHYLKLQQDAHTVAYESPRHGDIKLQLVQPAQSSRSSQYVWDASLMMSEFISETERSVWAVEGKVVLELGTGTGLASIVSVLCGAKDVMASDYPDSRLLENVKFNMAANVPKRSLGRVSVAQHLWGCVDDKLSREYEKKFDIVIAVECLSLEHQHGNIARSMAHFLKKDPDARVFVVSGFSLGRAKLENFFQIAFTEGLSVVTMFEQDATRERRDCYIDCPDSTEEILERGWLLVAQMGWHNESDADLEEEVQIEFKNLDTGTTKKARPKSMLVRG